MSPNNIIIPHGGYKYLITYKKSVIIFEGTVVYCRRFLRLSDRTIDQMVQAARSCKQNIAEGSSDSVVSKKTELTLTGFARGSLAELLEDYRDQLCSHGQVEWEVNSEPMVKIRTFCKKHDEWSDYRELFEMRDLIPLCNLQICLIQQTCYLLDRQLNTLAKDLEVKGGLHERISAVRHDYRAADWEKKIFDYFQAAQTIQDLNRREQQVLREVARCKKNALQKLSRKK